MQETAPTARGYRTEARLLHWLTALVVLATIPVGLIMTTEGLPRPIQDSLFIFHKNIGVVILLLVAARLILRAASPPPPLPADMNPAKRKAAVTTHVLLYLLLIVMGISGYVRVRAGGFPIEWLDALGAPTLVPRSDELEETAKSVHAVTKNVLIAVIFVHVGAALHHALMLRDGVFSRMWPPRRPPA